MFRSRRRGAWALRLPAIYLVLVLAGFLYAMNALSAPCEDPDCLSAFQGLVVPGLLLLPWIDWIGAAHATAWLVYGLPVLLNSSILALIGRFIDRRLAA